MADQTETRSEFARRAGVSAAAITKACRANGQLRAACVGDLIDIGHAAARAYLRGKGIVPPRAAIHAPDPAPPESADPAENYDLPEVGQNFRAKYPDVSTCLDLPLRVVVDEFGTVKKFREATTARKEIAATHAQELKNAERIGELIERAFVEQHLFGALEELARRLLSDAARTITRTNYANARSDVPLEQAEIETRNQLSAAIRRAKENAKRKLDGVTDRPVEPD